MKNLSAKKIAIGVVAIGIVVLGIFYFNTSKGTRPAPTYINPAFGEYIASYTAGVLSSGTSIRIVLSKEVIDSSMIGEQTSVKLFSFSPSITGKTIWLDRRTVEFRPDTRLTSGQLYEVNFHLSRLLDVPKELGSFEYTFQTIAQNFEVSVDNVKPYVKTELKRQKVEGSVYTADFAENELVEKMLSPEQDGKQLSLSWTHTSDGKQHSFIIEDVARKADVSTVTLTISGKPLGIDRSTKQSVEIPSLSDFKLMNAKVVQSPNQYVVLQFSDPLKEKQNLKGLITIAGLSSLEFDIHDNEIWVYPPVRQAGTKTVSVEAGVQNILDYKMKETVSAEVVFEQVAPAVRFAGKGNILPSTDGLIFPFEAVNLSAVDVTITKIFESNILQFLQVNTLEGNREMHRVGRKVLRKTIQLNTTGVTDLGKWNRYTLDLAQLINAEPGAIYQVKIVFKKSYSTFSCEGEADEDETVNQFEQDDDDDDYDRYTYYDDYYYEDDYYYVRGYQWEQRDNPCHVSYYTSNRAITRNILASDLGITTKRGGDGKTFVFVTDLKNTQPLSGVHVELYNYQQQVIGSGVTGSDGKAVIDTKDSPFALVAKNGLQRGYLRLPDGEALPVSSFDVSGEVVQRGIKGFLYGDRGVWRPGDSLYLTFILEDKNKLIPPTHPVVFEFQNPQGQVVNRLVRSSSENGFYNFSTATSSDAPTGNWTGRIKVGGTEFTQTLKIETVKPNRLKINLDFGTDKFTGAQATGKLNVKWLHGAPGRNLKAEFDMLLVKVPTKFPKYRDYLFEDPSRQIAGEPEPVFDGQTDADGNATVNVDLSLNARAAPGFLSAVFRGKVFEESGNFSIDRFSIPYYPYPSYVGMKTPEGEKYSGILYFDKPHQIDLVTVDINGNPVSRNDLEINVYKLNWRWWWDNSSDGIANYIEGSYSKLVKKGTAKTTNGKGIWTLEMKSAQDEWGRYFVRVCDPVSGHCTGKIIYIDSPGWYSRMRDSESREGASLLSFTTDKTSYNIGEKANITIPSSAQGRALVSLENGSRVVQTYWIETQQGETRFSFDVTPEMTPNVYVNVALLQPHAQTVNDLPIRLYGVSSIGVEDPNTRLEPVVVMPDVLEPGQEVSIKISEKAKRKMTYTVAVVDEGLLDITRFKTPDAWSRFYAREALGVRTWDVFDNVMGAFGARIERLLAVGGDSELAAKNDDPRANRFKPVVKFFGPFTVDGGSNTHKFIMPQYIGSVKTMVVAGYEGAYGKTEKVTLVRKPLMVLATLPRVLGPEETLKLPITLFTQEKNIKNIKVDIKTTGPLSVSGEASRSVSMPASGDLTMDFDVSVKSQIGIAKVEVTATSGKYKATDVIEIEIRNPNTPVTKVTEMLLEAGKTWIAEVVPYGIAGTNTAVLEVSNMPPVNLGSRLRYLIQYPHGCIEQTTSSVFPQLYVGNVKVLTDGEKASIQRNVTAGIERLKSFVQRDGGFGYWPGAENSDSWGTSYAGHFLIEAEGKGFYVPDEMLKRWKKYQKNKAAEWKLNDSYYNHDLMQAYRLYTLALAGAPELGAMNRLREQGKLSSTAAWMLAASYAKAGQPEAAKKLVSNLSTTVKSYRELGYSYGSDVRDKALIMETLVWLNDKAKAFELLKDISRYLSDDGYWLSTQETAFCLKAIGAFANMEKRGELKFTYVLNGKTVKANTELPVAQVHIPITGNNKEGIKIDNESKGLLYTRIIVEGTPARGEEEDAQSNLSLSIRYTDSKGNDIDVSQLEQGTEFLAEVTVTHTGIRSWYENLALTQVFPSGWEINNLRLTGDEQFTKSSSFNYQDIRDDRVYTYFGLNANERKKFKIILTASYAGKYYLPATSCEAMYDKSIYARKKGMVTEVVKRVTQ